jgi:hypothetical protein
VPTNQAFPYVVVSTIAGRLGTLLTFGKDATDIFLQTSIFDQNTGFSRARGIAKQIHADMEVTPLTLAGGFLNISLFLENYQELMESDGLTSLIAQRWKLMVQG